jgi:tetratricopeptide (TPR) repeat protein
LGRKSVSKKDKRLPLAQAHRRVGRLKDALGLYRQILDGEPENVAALVDLAEMSLGLGQAEGAASMILRALTCDPEDGQCLNVLDQVLATLKESGSQAQVLFEYSQILKESNLWDKALVTHRQAIRLKPTLANTDNFDSVSLLARGNLEQGWLAFEWRNTVGSLGPFTDKVWNGENLSGKTILVWGEQGIGDQIMFSTCLRDIIQQAGLVIIGTDDRLVPLFERSFPKAAVRGVARYTANGETRIQDFEWLEGYPPVDFFVLQGSLARFFRPSIASFPSTSNRLLGDPQRVKHWGRKLAELGPGKKIGICWRSHLVERQSRYYPALPLWQPLFNIKDAHFISMQAGVAPEEIQMIKDNFGVDITIFSEIDFIENIDDTAALCGALDSVVTTMVSLQWLAAAVGTPVWSIARGLRESEWCMLGQEHYPWFPELNVCLEEADDLLVRGFRRAAKDFLS